MPRRGGPTGAAVPLPGGSQLVLHEPEASHPLMPEAVAGRAALQCGYLEAPRHRLPLA
ncbi:hypothetical protein [Streptomyces sp. NPDC051286]|uniref:hypothetical protein n=1 Tax=Streptomyces sp. NPDC051286 TaxID=3365647 RepID=UPI00378DCD34